MYEDAFEKMKRAAGVSNIEEVVQRYSLLLILPWGTNL